MNNTSKEYPCAPQVRPWFGSRVERIVVLIVICILMGSLSLGAQEPVPVADAGVDRTVMKDQLLGSSVLLDGSGSFPASGNALEYVWYGPFLPANSVHPQVFIPEGVYTVSLVVSEQGIRSDPDTAVITVEPCFSLVARAKSGKVQIAWTHLEGTDHYDVYRAHESDPFFFEKIAETTTTYASYLDYSIENENTYLYLVGALKNGQWCYSDVVSAHPTAIRTRGQVNYSPKIYSPPISHGTAGIIYTYDVNATDPNADPILYSLAQSPPGMVINPEDGHISWVPDAQGEYPVIVEVSDARGGVDTQEFVIAVTSLNRPPCADAGGPYSAKLGEAILCDGSGSSDPDADPLSFAWDFGDGQTGIGVTASHTYSEAGSYQVLLQVSDGKGGTASDTTDAVIIPLPTIHLDGVPSTIISGEPAALVWTSEHADTVIIDHGIGPVDLSGARSVSPFWTTTYTITATGPGGSAIDSATITVLQRPTVTMNAHPETITEGNSSSLSWTSSNAENLVIEPVMGDVSAYPDGSAIVSPEETTTYTITATGPGGSATDSAVVTVHPSPSVDISANPPTIIQGETSLLTWGSSNADTCAIDQEIGLVDSQGTMSVTPLMTTTYTITAAGVDCVTVDSATVTVLHPPTVDLSADPETISAGSGALLHWESYNADSVSIDKGIGPVDVNGERLVHPQETTTYTISAQGQDGSATDSATVVVHTSPAVTLAAVPQVIMAGESSVLSWTSMNATEVSIDHDIGSVPSNGSVNVFPTEHTTYTITAAGPGGTATASSSVDVYYAPTVGITANPNPILSGETTTLNWTSEHADQGTIDQGIGDVASEGSLDVTPETTTTYSILVLGQGGSAADSVTVTVLQPPEVSISANPNPITSGESTFLNWTSENADDVSIDQSVGEVDSEGSRLVTPTETTTYTIIAHGQGGTAQDSVVVVVDQPQSQGSARAYITNNDADDVSLIDLSTNTVLLRIPVSYAPYGIAVSPDGSRVYVTCEDSGVSVIDTTDNSVLTTLDVYAICVAVSHDCSILYAVSPWESTVRALSTSNFAFLGSAEVGMTPHGIAISPDDARVYVASLEDGAVTVLDAQDLEVIDTIDLGPGATPLDIEIAPDGTKAYVTSFDDGTVKIINTQANTIAGVIDIYHIPEINPYPRYLAISPDGSRVYVTCEDGYISMIDTSTDAVTGSFFVGYGMSDLCCTPSGEFLYVPDRVANAVKVFETASTVQTSSVEEQFDGPYTCGSFIAVSGSRVSGQVMANGIPCAGVRVYLSGDTLERVALTNAQGTYTFYVPAGEYTLRAEMEGYGFSPHTVTVQCAGGGATAPDIDVLVGVDLSAAPPVITIGEPATLTWAAHNAEEVFIDRGIGSVDPDGSVDVWPEQTTKYTITATHASGVSVSKSVTVVVIRTPEVSISADPDTIVCGETASLSWTSQYADALSIDNRIGGVLAAGSRDVSPSESTTYTITASGLGGTAVDAVEVMVIPRPTVSISADPPEIPQGGTALLTWTSANADLVEIDNGIGPVESQGSFQVSPDSSTVYTITATGPGGVVTGLLAIPVHAPPIVEIIAEPSTIDQGESCSLTWNCANATLVQIDHSIGTVSTSGTVDVSPSETTTYTLTAAGSGGTSAATVTIHVVEPLIAITSPTDGDTISRPDVLVTGKLRDSCTGEVRVTVNGMPALVFGDTFVANHVPLLQGENTITARLVCPGGDTGEASIDIESSITRLFITLAALEYSGLPGFQTQLSVDSLFRAENKTITDSGPDAVIYTDQEGKSCTVTMDQEGIYYFTAQVTKDEVYTDTIAIVVQNSAELDTLITSKWNAMRTCLENGDVDGAMEYFTARSRDMFEYNFTLMHEHLPEIVAGMQDIQLVKISDGVAVYEMWAEQDGEMYSFLVRFVIDADGIWKIDFF